MSFSIYHIACLFALMTSCCVSSKDFFDCSSYLPNATNVQAFVVKKRFDFWGLFFSRPQNWDVKHNGQPIGRIRVDKTLLQVSRSAENDGTCHREGTGLERCTWSQNPTRPKLASVHYDRPSNNGTAVLDGPQPEGQINFEQRSSLNRIVMELNDSDNVLNNLHGVIASHPSFLPIYTMCLATTTPVPVEASIQDAFQLASIVVIYKP